MWKDFLKEYIEYVELDSKKDYYDQEMIAYLIKWFLQLWYKPNESLSDFKKWYYDRMERYDITAQQFEYVIDNFVDYWSESWKTIKIFKTTFFNNPLLRRYLKPWYVNMI